MMAARVQGVKIEKEKKKEKEEYRSIRKKKWKNSPCTLAAKKRGCTLSQHFEAADSYCLQGCNGYKLQQKEKKEEEFRRLKNKYNP
jgi:hypothetical protein